MLRYVGFRVWCWISLRRVVRELFETQFTELRAYFVWSLRGDSFSLGASTEFRRASAGLYTITNFVEEVSEVTAEKATAQVIGVLPSQFCCFRVSGRVDLVFVGSE